MDWLTREAAKAHYSGWEGRLPFLKTTPVLQKQVLREDPTKERGWPTALRVTFCSVFHAWEHGHPSLLHTGSDTSKQALFSLSSFGSFGISEDTRSWGMMPKAKLSVEASINQDLSVLQGMYFATCSPRLLSSPRASVTEPAFLAPRLLLLSLTCHLGGKCWIYGPLHTMAKRDLVSPSAFSCSLPYNLTFFSLEGLIPCPRW